MFVNIHHASNMNDYANCCELLGILADCCEVACDMFEWCRKRCERKTIERKKRKVEEKIRELMYDLEVSRESVDLLKPQLTQLQIEREELNDKIGKYKME